MDTGAALILGAELAAQVLDQAAAGSVRSLSSLDVQPFLLAARMLADDIVVLARTAERLQQILTALEAACQRWGLTISQSKTELMLVGGQLTASSASSQSSWRPDIWVGGSVLCWVEKFKYLGSHFTHDIDPNIELIYRLLLGAAVMWRLWGPFFSQRGIKLHTRLTVFKGLVLSGVLYGCESLALTCAQQHRLDVFVKSCIRRMLGLGWMDHIGYEELYRRCGREDKPFGRIVAHWRRRLLRFLGRLGRMPESRLAKCILWATLPDGVGRRGRLANPLLPKVYEEHLKQLDLGGARRQHQDRMDAEGGLRFGFNWLSACAIGTRGEFFEAW
ncbi:hypothetical protein N2152v2_010945 [Parachlorella kessleri]